MKTRPLVSSKTMSIGSRPTGTSATTAPAARSTTVTASLRAQATYARRPTSIATPSGSRPVAISATKRYDSTATIIASSRAA